MYIIALAVILVFLILKLRRAHRELSSEELLEQEDTEQEKYFNKRRKEYANKVGKP